MGNWTMDEVEALARKILVTYFCSSDVEFMISTFADDIIWLGGGSHMKAEGKEAVAACFRSGKGAMIACDMSEEEYHTAKIGDGCYLCEGISRLQSRPEAECWMDVEQRVTFIFRERGDRLETVHIHNSVPYEKIKDDELFPVEMGREEYMRLQWELHEKDLQNARQVKFLEQLYDTVPCGIIQFSTDREHKVIALNPMVWKFYGYASEEGYLNDVRSPLEKVNKADYDRIVSVIESLVLNGETKTYRRQCRKKNGEEAWINVVMGRLVNSNGLEVIQAVFTDITQFVRMEQEQEQDRLLENRSLRAAICSAYPLIISLNLTRDTYDCFVDDQSLYSFPKKGKYTELTELCISGIYETYREDFAAVFDRGEVLRRFAGGDREIYMELQQSGNDGIYHWIAVHMIYVENPFNEDVHAIILAKTLDAQRQEQARQEQLLRDALASAKAASRAKSDFLSRMSHDIRTPMNAIIGMNTIGQLKIDDTRCVKDCFQKIDASAKFLLSLINDILDMSKIETEKMELAHEVFDFRSFADEVNQIIYPQASGKYIHYEMRHREPMDHHYVGDCLRLKQILMNLLSNSIKFTPSGGSICVDICESKRTNGYAYVQFIVSDTGVGMSEEFMQKIFLPFEQEAPGNARNNVGSGLGLSIVYNLVQLMGGEIRVRSAKNLGTTFTFVVPFELVTYDEEKEWERKRQNLLKGFQVLVADDDPSVGRQAAGILNDIGAKTTFVDSGLKAVEEVEKGIREDCMFDIAMIDWKMPGIDGIETARQIRRLVGPDTMIIIISAYDWSEIEKEAREAGIDCFIAKPLFRSVIYDTFSRLGEKEKQEKSSAGMALKGARILLAEDNELNQEVAKTLLEMHGAAVDVADNGQAALDCFLAHEAGTYQVILMDIRMPVLDGMEVTRQIRAADRSDSGTIPIIAMTANAFEKDKKMAYEASMNGYLVKPLDVNVMIAELKKVLRKHPKNKQPA